MNILLVSSYLPYPLYSGGQVRLYNLMKELSKHHSITLVCERRPSETDADIREVEKICKKVITVNRKKQWSLSTIAKAGTSSKSFLSAGHHLPAMQAIIQRLLHNSQFDVIHVETYYVMQNVPETTIPIVLVEHNIEYKVYERFKERAPSPLKPLLYLDIAKIKKEEEFLWKRANKVVAVSKEDASVMQTAGIDASVVSNGVNTDQFAFKDHQKREKKILFIGDFKWLQNKDSATYIIKEVWPEIKARITKPESHANVTLWFVARNIPDSIRSLTNDPNVLFDEESSLKKTEEIFQEASILLAPIRVGGGTSYKILEAMSCGTPVVTMQLSANALEAKDGSEMMVGSDPKSLATKTVQLLEDAQMYTKISVNGRAFVEAKYAWKEISLNLNKVYASVVKRIK